MTTETTVANVPYWINGRQATPKDARRLPVTDSATGEVVRKVPCADATDIDLAVESAKAAFAGWRATPPLRRARILMRFRDLLVQHKSQIAAVVTEEHGKTLEDAEGSVQRGLEVVEFATGIPHLLKGEHSEDVGAGIDSHTVRQPLGVCAGITPFNFPVMCPLWMIPVALACGNTFILKPSEKDPSASVMLAHLLKEAGLPDGVLNVVQGDKEAVNALLQHPGIAAVSFVGSTPIARHVYETGTAAGKRVQALGGAKNHAVVLPDADLDGAADALIGAGYGSAGERCMAISAIVAVGEAGDALVSKLSERAQALSVGPGDREGVQMGPLITAEHAARVTGYIDTGADEGAKVIVDGRGLVVAGHEKGHFVGPTLFDQVTDEMTIYRDEIFGPVLVVLRTETLGEAIDLINRNPYGNGTAVFTRSGAAARRFANEIQVGMVGVNVPIPVPMAFFSFGGWKSSLFGDLHVHGPEGVKFYTRTKVVTTRWPVHQDGVSLTMPTMK
ncbi:MAG: methylmalonate-semialdehyde dehydrogenase (CoA acylating) [Acidobacteria bacterium]|nr:methylmalonate-semialdehyde dehydrogenase (CoA acylating) [Acidobacteriota bacterium]|tara:strand:- start:4673 stop:6181 length:1509 start_codon:yes stop_codon:yes gene_type:complete